MVVTTFLILFPLAFFASAIYTYLIFSKHKLFSRIKHKALRIVIRIIAYTMTVIILSIILSMVGMILLMGIIGIPVLLVLDVIAIIFLIRRIFKNSKIKQFGNITNEAIWSNNYYIQSLNLLTLTSNHTRISGLIKS